MFHPDEFPTTKYDRLYEEERSTVFRFESIEAIKKQNAEFKRIITAYEKFRKEFSTVELLSKKDFAALKRGEDALHTLKTKRANALYKKENAERALERFKMTAAGWIKGAFGDMTTEDMLKVIRAGRGYVPSWITWESDVEKEFKDVLKDTFARFVEVKADAKRVADEINNTLANKDDPRIIELNMDVQERLKILRK